MIMSSLTEMSFIRNNCLNPIFYIMRKVLYTLAGIAAFISVASCNKNSGSSSKESDVVFNVQLASGAVTKVDGISEAASVDVLDVFVYDASGSYISSIVPTVTKTDQTHYVVKMRLLNNVAYNFVFFAQKSGSYTYSADKKTITVDYSSIPANNDAYDAFYARVNNYTVPGIFTQNVTLHRPFAQINFGSVKTDYEAALASQVTFDASLKTSITVSQAPSVLSLLDGSVSVPVDAVFQASAYMGSTASSNTLSVDSSVFPGATPVRYIGMAYILAGSDAASTVTKVTLNYSGSQNGNAFNSARDVTNVPVRANYRTQIVGNVFTDEGTFNITLDPAYYTPEQNVNL